MGFLADKAVDCLFIFLGVYIAFAFTEWQETNKKKDELRYHVEQILSDLPNSEPNKKFKNLAVTAVKSDSGDCRIMSNSIDGHRYSAARHLDVIINRGLGSYLPDQRILTELSNLYFDAEPRYKEMTKQLQESIDGDKYIKSLQLVVSDSKSCQKVDELNSYIDKHFQADYKKLKVSDILLQHHGFRFAQQLEKMGYKKVKGADLATRSFVDVKKTKKTGDEFEVVVVTEEVEDEKLDFKQVTSKVKKFLDRTRSSDTINKASK